MGCYLHKLAPVLRFSPEEKSGAAASTGFINKGKWLLME